MAPEVLLEQLRKKRFAILIALGRPQCDTAAIKIQVFDPEPHGFVEAQSASINEPDHQKVEASHVVENQLNFLGCQHHGQPLFWSGAHRLPQVSDILI